MEYYKQNVAHLCDQKGISLTEFENIIYIPKVRIIDPTPPELLRIANYFNLSLDTIVKKDLKLVDKVSANNIKLVVLDVDGTLTDGGIYYTENGDTMKKFNSKDGLAIKRKTSEGLLFGIISHAFKSNTITERAELLGIQKVYVGQGKKIDVLKNWCTEHNLSLKQVAYVGDDINDLDVMNEVGLAACPNDAIEEIKKASHIILSKNGGNACVREFIDDWLS